MRVLRTPDAEFADIPAFSYSPSYADLPDGDGGELRVAWIDAGPPHGKPVLLLHGEPTWSFLFRRTIPVLIAAGHRVVCPDLIGFGRSDKPALLEDHSYARHVEWMRALAFDVLDLRGVTLVGQDWGGLIGLRLAAENADRFVRIVVVNTGLPTGDLPMPNIWWSLRDAIQGLPHLKVGKFVRTGCRRPMDQAVCAAYDAPFPDDSYCAGPRAMPALVPVTPEHPAAAANRAAWAALQRNAVPMLVVRGADDPLSIAMAEVFQRDMPGAHGIDHPVIKGAGHFLPEDAGEELGEAIVAFLAD